MTNPTNPQLSLFDRESAWEQQTKREPMPPPPSPGPPPVARVASTNGPVLELLYDAEEACAAGEHEEAETLISRAVRLLESS